MPTTVAPIVMGTWLEINQVDAVLLIGLCAGLIAIWGIISQRDISRRRATIEYIAKTEIDNDMIKARRDFVELARASGGLAPWADVDKEKEDKLQSIKIVLNEFELISIAIQRGVFDFQIYSRWKKTGTIQYWRFGAPFIVALRARTDNDALFHEFEEMVKWLKGEQMPHRTWWWGKFF
jgi:hypothetical protein